ncbi:FadR/GntR family transcriptional regulator [Streptomyces sp. NPDC091377]|uniref:FadR/GntR family transcriptional regulator n=1 Tax=Streptomyces sp. NPDC091377 TaxID=3365995 RepID=UPI0038007497
MNGNKKSSGEIADTLRERIRAGELKAGERLPTQAVLAETYGVERGTVREALRALQADGLLTHVSKGSPPRVAGSRPDPGRSRAARVVLSSYLAEAFREPDVRIDAVCFTAETLLWAIGEVCRLVAQGDVRPDTVEVRCLLPGPGVALPYPVPVPADDEPALRQRIDQRIKRQITNQMEVMASLAQMMAGYGIDAKVVFRALPFVPSVKQYVLNGTLVLQGNYRVGLRPYEVAPGAGEIQVMDVSGFASSLFEFRRDRGGQDEALVDDTRKCFEALWELCPPRSTLGS